MGGDWATNFFRVREIAPNKLLLEQMVALTATWWR
jgi:hypothetical protein